MLDRDSQHTRESGATVVNEGGLQRYYHGGGVEQEKQ
jgi:hypothetical protein